MVPADDSCQQLYNALNQLWSKVFTNINSFNHTTTLRMDYL